MHDLGLDLQLLTTHLQLKLTEVTPGERFAALDLPIKRRSFIAGPIDEQTTSLTSLTRPQTKGLSLKYTVQNLRGDMPVQVWAQGGNLQTSYGTLNIWVGSANWPASRYQILA